MKQLNKLTKRLLIVSLAFFSFGFVHAQIQVSGKLTDSKGEALVAASVAEVGTNNGTFTEYDGTWTLTVKSPESVLEFSYVGLKTQTQKVGTKRVFNVALQADAIIIPGVVKIGYASAKPEDVTGGIVQLKGEEVAKAPVLGVDQALQGKAAGVQVRSNSGTPGGGMDIVVRGRGTTGDARPLYVVDGVPVGYEWKGDPNNIESISILKDASSCAIYGARGANGVVLITTKGGNEVTAQEEFLNVSFDGYRGSQERWKKFDVMSGDEYAEYYGLENTDGVNTDWQDEIFQTATIQKYKITLDGGSPKTSWSASGGYTNQDGIIKSTAYEKYDFGYKGMYQVNKKIDVGFSTGFSVTTQDKVYEGDIENSIIGNALIASPMSPIYDSTGEYAQMSNSAIAKNPLAMIEYGNYATPNLSEKGYGLGTNIWASYDIVKNLEFRSIYNYGKWGKEEFFYIPYFNIASNQNNPLPRYNTVVREGNNWGTTNTLQYSYDIKDKYDSTRVKHAFKVLAGHEALFEFQKAYRYELENIPDDKNMHFVNSNKPTSDNPKGVWAEVYDAANEHSMISYIGRLEYGLSDKYNVNATIRRDGSSRFGSGYKYGNFPSVGVAWKVNKESFFYNNKVLTDSLGITMFKIRGGWGKIGNENVRNYLYVGTIISDPEAGYSFGGNQVQGVVPEKIPNENVHWEEATSWNIGTDINVFKNKIMFNYDYFIKTNYDNLITIDVPAIAQAKERPTVNAGLIRNAGHEVSLLYRNQFKTDSMKQAVKYDVNVNFTKINNEVLDMQDGQIPGGLPFGDARLPTFVCNTTEGYPIAAFFGYKVDGIYESWEEVNEGSQSSARPGDYKIVDINGDGVIDGNDITMIGSPHPDFTYGVNANVGYAGFDFGFSFQGVQGNEIFNATKYYLDGGGSGNSNLSTRRLDVWSEDNAGSENPTNAEWFVGTGVGANLFPHSGYIEDGSYLRLKNITLGYTLPERITDKIKMNRLRLYVQSQNLLTFTKYSGFDPEIGTNTTLNWRGPEFGIDRGVYPQARTYIFGVNIEF